MKDNQLTYLLTRPYDEPDASPTAGEYSELPDTFVFNSTGGVFGNDQWRALAGFSRKYESGTCSDYKYCDR